MQKVQSERAERWCQGEGVARQHCIVVPRMKLLIKSKKRIKAETRIK